MLVTFFYSHCPVFIITSHLLFIRAHFLVKPNAARYHGILINTGVGNPTAPLITALGDKRVLPGKWGRLALSAHVKG